MSSFQLTIRTPDKDVYTGTVNSVSFHAEDGQVQVLAHHASYMATILFSTVRVDGEAGGATYLARNGFFYFDHKKNEALMLCLYCEEQSEVSYQTVEEYLRFLASELEKGDLSDFQVVALKGEKLSVEKQLKSKK